MHRAYSRLGDSHLDSVGERKGEVHLCVFFGGKVGRWGGGQQKQAAGLLPVH